MKLIYNNNYLVLIMWVSCLLTFSMCNVNTDSNGLVNDPQIIVCFSKDEIKGLAAILNSFDKQVQTFGNQKDIKEAYNSFIENLKAQKSIEGYNGLVDKIAIDPNNFEKEEIFDAIWERNRSNNNLTNRISLKLNSKYTAFLKLLASENSLIHDYYSSIEVAGSLSAVSNGILQQQYTSFDFNKASHRLIIAIHFSTLKGEGIAYRHSD